TLGYAVPIDRPQEVFGPAWRIQFLQGVLDAHEIRNDDRGPIALILRNRTAVIVGHAQYRADPERLTDVAGQRLLDRPVVLHPVEFPDVPQIGITDRRGGGLVVGGREVIAEYRVGDAPQGIRAPEAF